MDLNVLREANALRLPQFKSKHGELAHSTQDGSDWTPCEWLQALIGEVGELCEARLRSEYHISPEKSKAETAGELADVQTYLDICSTRMLDRVVDANGSSAQTLVKLVTCIGVYANTAKKLKRGDLGFAEFENTRRTMLGAAIVWLQQLMSFSLLNVSDNGKVVQVGESIDLGQATIDKFNEVSDRIGVKVHIGSDEKTGSNYIY